MEALWEKHARLLNLVRGRQLSIAVDTVGALLREKSETEKAYKAARAVLEKRIKKEVGVNRDVTGSQYTAYVGPDTSSNIDVLEFLEKVKDEKLRQKCLRVLLGEARKRVGRHLLQELIETVDEKPSLHINLIKQEK